MLKDVKVFKMRCSFQKGLQSGDFTLITEYGMYMGEPDVTYQWDDKFRSWDTDLTYGLEHIHFLVHLQFVHHVTGSRQQTTALVAISSIWTL